jgi:hypothetical protein
LLKRLAFRLILLAAMGPILLLVIITACARPGFAIQAKAENRPPAPKAEKTAAPDAGAKAERRRQSALMLRDFANRALAFKDPVVKAYTLTDLAALLWKEDQAFARQLFLRAYDTLLSAEQAEAKNTLTAKEAGQDIASLRTEVVSRLAKFDPALAKQLIETDAGARKAGGDTPEGPRADLRSAIKLVEGDNVPEAVTFVERSLQGGVPDRVIAVLLALRQKDVAAANRLYVETLNRLAAQPLVNGRVLLSLGLYVFTSPGIDPSDPSMAGAFGEVPVGGMSVFDVSSARPDVQRSITRAYLNTAVSVIARSLSDPRQQQLYYVVAHQLLPHARIFLPERAAELAAAMQTLTRTVPAATVQDTADAFAPPKKFDADEESQKIDAISDAAQHDNLCLAVVYVLYSQKEFARARAVNAKIKDPDLRSELANTIAFGEASLLLERGDVARAVEASKSLAPTCVERALLRIGVAHHYIQQKNKAQSSEALYAALEDARRVSDERKPLLLMSLAGEYASVAPASAQQVFLEAVRAFNTSDAGGAASFGWLDSNDKAVASQGGVYRHFPLEVKGVTPKLDDAIRQMAAADSDGTAAALLGLTPEKVLGAVMVAFARSLPM